MRLKFSVRFLISLCVVLCFASAAFCIDPYKVNRDGFGPKIKGLQLGMRKEALLNYVLWGINNVSLPFTLHMGGKNSRIDIKFTGEVIGQELKDFNFEITNCSGSYEGFKNLSLDDLMTKIEEVDPVKEIYCNGISMIIYFNNMGRISHLYFTASIFGANSMTPREFAEAIVAAYGIPGMDSVAKDCWRHRELSQGWQIDVNRNIVEITPIITENKFN